MNNEIGNPEMAWLLLLVPIALALFGYQAWSRRSALAKFGSKIKTGQTVRGFVSALLLTSGIVLLALACMDIRWGKTTREVPQKGIEVVFALDVSRSMLAQDARPNRLARAKQQITDMVGEMAGDRVGLVVFAGEATQAVPLTNHYNDFRQKLDAVGPQSVPTGGSQLGVAIQAASEAFISKTSDHKTIVLFTDGEDQESRPVELAKQLHADNAVRIFTVGLGDIDKGSRIPQGQSNAGQFVEHEGQQVWSKLNGSILKQIATQTKAAYIPAGTKRVNMADVYHNYFANVEKSEFETAKINGFIPRFQWFAFPAFLCLFAHTWVSSGAGKNESARKLSSQAVETVNKTNSPLASTKSKVAAALLVLLPSVVNAQSVTSQPEASANKSIAAQINAANELVRQDEYQEAIEAFNMIDSATIDEAESNHQDSLNYNLAAAHYRNAGFDAAKTLFAETAKSSDDRIAADSRYNLGNCHYANALPLAEQDPQSAIAQLETAIQHYRSALRLDRQLTDARENLERARKLIEQLRQEEQSQDQQQDQSEKSDQQDQSNESNESDESQEQSEEGKEKKDNEQKDQRKKESENSQDSQDSQESAESKDSDSQSSDQQSSDEDDSQSEQNQSQQNGSEESESQQSSSESQPNQPSDASDENSQSSQGETPNEQQENANQQPANSNSEQDETDPNSETQQDKDESKNPPQGTVTASNESQPGEPGDESAMGLANSTEDNGMMSRQEALKLLQAVRDRDMLRRLRQQQLQRQRRVRVEKDW